MRMRKTIGLSLVLLVASSAAMARKTESADQQPATSIKAKHSASSATEKAGKRQRASRKSTARSERASRHYAGQAGATLPPPDRYLGPVRVVGAREVGSAAWYGGRHIGMRTASGDRLDALHPTAAHRSLPLHSLVRVTNLRNGRSVIAKITDRGPVSRSLLIDLSPRCAEELDMKRSGIATVAVEPVAPAASPPAAAETPSAAIAQPTQVASQTPTAPSR